MFGLSGWEIPAIILLALLFFGGTKLPELARGFGKSLNAFKEEVNKDDDETEEEREVEEVKTASAGKAKKSSAKTSKKSQ
jgi:sec-independent protein translocase protein TatA